MYAMQVVFVDKQQVFTHYSVRTRSLTVEMQNLFQEMHFNANSKTNAEHREVQKMLVKKNHVLSD